jgi:hypothetical protein
MMMMTKRSRISLVVGAIVLTGAAGCASETAEAGDGGASAAGKVTISEPAEGESVEIPFAVKLDSSVGLGSTESGRHHVHLYFDGDDSKYEVVESGDVEITDSSPAVDGLKSGEHELTISLRNADHSAAGFETSVTVRVGGGDEPADDGATGGGY